MRLKAFTALLLAVLLFGSTGLAAGQVSANNVPAIQHTISSSSDNPQIADTSAKTSNSNAAVAPAKASLQQQTAPGAQNAAPAVTPADQIINTALVQTTNLATQIVQAAPPVSSLIKPVSATPDSISLAAAPGQQVMLNPDGVTFAGSPTESSMTIGNAGVRYNDPQENVIPGQVAGSNFPGQGYQVVQNAPLNDEGTGPAPVGGSHFQPLGTNVGGVSTPQQRTEDALASMGQGGHNRQASGQVAGGDKYQNNPFFRNYDANSQRSTSYAANVPTTASLLGGGAGAHNPNAVTLTGPGGNSVSLGRKLLREILVSDLLR